MEQKSRMSLKTKKILVGVGIGFGTVFVFILSFILAFILIINPISLSSVSDDEIAKENKELKETLQTVKDENEHLKASNEKYEAMSNTTVFESQPASTTPATVIPGGNTETSEKSTSDESNQTQDTNTEADTEESFSPETVTNTGDSTPEDVDEPIRVIEIK